jgi:hypothetical protein
MAFEVDRRTKDRVISALRAQQADVPLTAILDTLEADGLGEGAAKAAVWDLIADDVIELTARSALRMHSRRAATAGTMAGTV